MYEKLIKSLRTCSKIDTDCIGCLKEGEIIHKFCWLELMSEAATAIEELQKPKWIPVTERLPDYDKAVLCHCRANIIETLCLENDGHWYGYSGRYMKGFVTHWMLLPEPPKEETDG